MERENLLNYLRRILIANKNYPDYDIMRTEREEYKKFIRLLGYPNFFDEKNPLICENENQKNIFDTIENIYLYFHKEGIHVATLVKKGESRNTHMDNLMKLRDKTLEYFNSNVNNEKTLDKIKEQNNIKNTFLSVYDLEINSSLGGILMKPKFFIIHLEKCGKATS